MPDDSPDCKGTNLEGYTFGGAYTLSEYSLYIQ